MMHKVTDLQPWECSMKRKCRWIQAHHEDEKKVCERYSLFPKKEACIGKILFIETCEEKWFCPVYFVL